MNSKGVHGKVVCITYGLTEDKSIKGRCGPHEATIDPYQTLFERNSSNRAVCQRSGLSESLYYGSDAVTCDLDSGTDLSP